MATAELRNLQVDKVVDARGMSCPGPLLEAKRSITAIPKGGIMEVLSSDNGTTKDIPQWAKKIGHEYLGSLEEAGYWKLYVKRMK